MNEIGTNVINLQPHQGAKKISWSSCYTAKSSDLTREHKNNLKLIEAKFKQGCNFDAHSKVDLVIGDVSIFECAEGKLFYCKAQSSVGYLLLDFRFDAYNGGGCFSDGVEHVSPPNCYGQVKACFKMFTDSLVHNLRSFIIRTIDTRSESRLNSVNDLMRFQSALFLSNKGGVRDLPAWSILHGCETSRHYHQIEFSFAKRIAVGEFACRLAEECDLSNYLVNRSSTLGILKNNLVGNISFLSDKTGFLQETKEILESATSTSTERKEIRTVFNYYKVPSILSEQNNPDCRAYSLLHGEVACFLSEIVTTQRLALQYEENLGKKDQLSRKLCIQYSLLCKFIYLSDSWIERKNHIGDQSSFNRELGADSKRYIHDIERFSESTNLLVTLLRPSSDKDLLPDIPDNNVQGKLVEIASELIEAQGLH